MHVGLTANCAHLDAALTGVTVIDETRALPM